MKFLSLLAAVLPLASGATIPERSPEKRLATPANDPFYVPPSGFESAAPGTVLRERSIIPSFLGFIPDPIDARQLLYRTTATDGSPIVTVTTVFKPWFAKTDRFVSFNTAYDSSATVCDPSYAYRLGAPQNSAIASAEFLLIQAYLLSGYTVASPDYEGPQAAFTPGPLSGMGVLDGIRAVSNYASQLGLDDNPMAVNVGYSGGAIASGWAASLQPHYAPELNIKGFVAGGTPANLTEVFLYVDGGIFSGFLPGAVAGLLKSTAYGAELGPLVDSIITPYGKQALANGDTKCTVSNLLSFADKSLLTTSFQSLGPNLLYQPAVAKVLTECTMGLTADHTPKVPVFLYHAQHDEIIPYVGATALQQRWCGNGASVHFTNYAAGGHVTTEVIAVPDALKFVAQAFDGSVPSGCSSNAEYTNTLNPLALGLDLEPLLTGLLGVLASFGNGDSNFIKSIQDGKGM